MHSVTKHNRRTLSVYIPKWSRLVSRSVCQSVCQSIQNSDACIIV